MFVPAAAIERAPASNPLWWAGLLRLGQHDPQALSLRFHEANCPLLAALSLRVPIRGAVFAPVRQWRPMPSLQAQRRRPTSPTVTSTDPLLQCRSAHAFVFEQSSLFSRGTDCRASASAAVPPRRTRRHLSDHPFHFISFHFMRPGFMRYYAATRTLSILRRNE